MSRLCRQSLQRAKGISGPWGATVKPKFISAFDRADEWDAGPTGTKRLQSVSGAKFGVAKAMPNSALGATWRACGFSAISTIVQASLLS